MQGLAGEKLKRGVYVAPYLVDDLEVLIAIDSRGRARKHVKMRAGVSEQRATAWLREWLDRIDPAPKLELVRDNRGVEVPAPAPRPTTIAGRLYSDPYDKRAYWRHLARAAAAACPRP